MCKYIDWDILYKAGKRNLSHYQYVKRDVIKKTKDIFYPIQKHINNTFVIEKKNEIDLKYKNGSYNMRGFVCFNVN